MKSSKWILILILSVFAAFLHGVTYGETTPRAPELLRNRTWISTGNPEPRVLPVPDFSRDPVHPRLFFREADLPELRARAEREPYATIVQRMRDYVEGEADGNPWYGLAWRIRVMAMLYVISGDQADADRTLEMVQELRRGRSREHRGVWHRVERRQLNLSEGSLSVAMAYDFCYHAWPEAVRREISRDLAEQARVQLHEYGPGFPSRGSANNWRGIRFAGAGSALLATDEPHLTPEAIAALNGNPMDPEFPFAGIDPRWFDVAYDQVLTYLRQARTDDVTARGMNAEGVGYMLYPHTHLGPYMLALDHMLGVKMTDDLPAAALGPVLAAMSAVPLPAPPEAGLHPAAGMRPDLANENPHYASQGELSVSLGMVLPGHLPAYLWHFDHFVGKQGTGDFQPGRAGLVFSFLHYPEDLPPENPEKIWGLTLLDRPTGTLVMRDRYRDERDVVFMTTARQRGVMRQTHHGAEVGSLRLFGEGAMFFTGGGRTTALGGQSIVLNSARVDANDNREAGRLREVYLAENGSGSFTILGSAAGVRDAVRMVLLDTDPSDSPARAHMLVADLSTDGDLWRVNTLGMNTVNLGPRHFEITAPNGAKLRGDVLFPPDPVLEQGVWDRAGTVDMHGVRAGENRWIQVRSRADRATRFLVAMQILPPDIDPAPVAFGDDQGFVIGSSRYLLTENGLREASWPRELRLQAEAVPETGGVIRGTGSFPPGAEVVLEAVPARGYRFVRWESDRPMAGHPWKTENVYPLKISDHTRARAIFEPVTP